MRFLNYLSQLKFDRKLLTKNANDPMKRPRDIDYDITRSQKLKNKIEGHDSSVWQQQLERMSSDISCMLNAAK